MSKLWWKPNQQRLQSGLPGVWGRAPLERVQRGQAHEGEARVVGKDFGFHRFYLSDQRGLPPNTRWEAFLWALSGSRGFGRLEQAYWHTLSYSLFGWCQTREKNGIDLYFFLLLIFPFQIGSSALASVFQSIFMFQCFLLSPQLS